MILKASTRGHGVKYARYLLNNSKNEQTRVFGIKGTASPDNAFDSIVEMGAYERFTRSKKPFLQVVINPENGREMTDAEWQDCVSRIENKIGFDGQPFVGVLHTYKGETHMHATWGRYQDETGTMKAVGNIALDLKSVRQEIEQDQGHKPLLSWQQKKAMKQEAEQNIKDKFAVNSQDITPRKKKPSELLAEAEAQRLQQEMNNGMTM